MTREEKEAKKKAGQALFIAEFPKVCRARINLNGPEYDSSAYWRLITLSWAAIISKLGRFESPPKIRKEWKLGMEVELKQAWDAELVKIKEESLKIARDKIPKICDIKVTNRCKDVQYPYLTEDTYRRILTLAFRAYYANTIPESWEDALREDVIKAWDAEVEKAKADGRIPKTLEDAYKIAWACMERTKPFEHHEWITTDGVVYAITNLIMGYPKSLWLTWTDHGPNAALSARFIPEAFIPRDIKENLQALYKEINARGAKDA